MKILLPIDGSHRSAYTIRMAKRLCRPEDEIHLVTVMAGKLYLNTLDDPQNLGTIPSPELDQAETMLAGYNVQKKVLLGSAPGVEIVEYAKKIGADALLMTRSSRLGLRRLGSVATYIVKNATFLDLCILNEEDEED